MPRLARISVSLEADLLAAFDRMARADGFQTRSEAVKGLMRERLVRGAWARGGAVAGSVTIVYDHHRRDVLARLVDIQHDFGPLVAASQHVHLAHRQCLEVLIVRGPAARIRDFAARLASVKGVRMGEFSIASEAGGCAAPRGHGHRPAGR